MIGHADRLGMPARFLRQLQALRVRRDAELRTLIASAAEIGVSSEAIAAALGVSRSTLSGHYGDEAAATGAVSVRIRALTQRGAVPWRRRPGSSPFSLASRRPSRLPSRVSSRAHAASDWPANEGQRDDRPGHAIPIGEGEVVHEARQQRDSNPEARAVDMRHKSAPPVAYPHRQIVGITPSLHDNGARRTPHVGGPEQVTRAVDRSLRD